MSLVLPPWNSSIEPTQSNIRQWLDNIWSKASPIEQARWNESNIDSLFYAGSQSFVNRYFGYSPVGNNQNWYFNLIQHSPNLIAGYQRQHRKGISFEASGGGDPETTDQYTKMMIDQFNTNYIHETFSKACEQSCVSGYVLLQPYMDYTGDDPIQGTLAVKLWEYNAFITDPNARDGIRFTDSNYIWTQEYISKEEAARRFKDKATTVSMLGSPSSTNSRFYFLPENFNLQSTNLIIQSNVWYKSSRKKRRLYSASRKQFFDFSEYNTNIQEVLTTVQDIEVVEVDVTTWKLCIVLNDTLVFHGNNPMGTDSCPFIGVHWNYEAHLNQPELRVRSLIRPARTAQFLFNYKIIQNNDIAAATINAGWKRKIGAVANEDNLKKGGQGYDVIINRGFELTDVEKIEPTSVPQSDLALAQQMAELIPLTTGIDRENWSAQDEKGASSLTLMIKQAANLTIFQKFFDQWDMSLKCLAELCLEMCINNWNYEKVSLILGEEPTSMFYSSVFTKYKTQVAETDLTVTQQNLQAKQMMDINEAFGREVFPPSMIIPKLNITGKAEIIEYLKGQEEQAEIMQQQARSMEDAYTEGQMRKLYAEAANQIAMARERHSRNESNLGLYEERLSMIERNRALSLKDKQDAIAKLLENVSLYGQAQTNRQSMEIELQSIQQELGEEREKDDVERRSASNKFLTEIMSL